MFPTTFPAIINGDNLTVLKTFPDQSIHLTVTSPPYDGIRDYHGFVFDFEPLAKELYRITVDGGYVVWVVGDQVIDGGESLTSPRQALFFQSLGFKMHDTMLYMKPGFPFPENVRYNQIFEYMFVLVKGSPRCFHPLKDRKVRNPYITQKKHGRNADGVQFRKEITFTTGEVGMRNNAWEYNNQPGCGSKDKIAYQHPAVFPEALAQDHILSWSNKGDIVLDPFAGSFTTVKMANLLGRKGIGVEISPEYCEIGKKRIAQRPLQIPNLYKSKLPL